MKLKIIRHPTGAIQIKNLVPVWLSKNDSDAAALALLEWAVCHTIPTAESTLTNLNQHPLRGRALSASQRADYRATRMEIGRRLQQARGDLGWSSLITADIAPSLHLVFADAELPRDAWLQWKHPVIAGKAQVQWQYADTLEQAQDAWAKVTARRNPSSYIAKLTCEIKSAKDTPLRQRLRQKALDAEELLATAEGSRITVELVKAIRDMGFQKTASEMEVWL